MQPISSPSCLTLAEATREDLSMGDKSPKKEVKAPKKGIKEKRRDKREKTAANKAFPTSSP